MRDQAFKRGHLRVSGDGIFYTLQGEGITQGIPAVFLRLHECNLQCRWGDTICDASYTWDRTDERYWSEPQDIEVEDLAQRVYDYMALHSCFRLVISGGEPLIQKRELDYLLSNLIRRFIPDPFGKIWIEIETNGTIAPTDYMVQYAGRMVLQFNVSPKLTSSGNSPYRALKVESLKEFALTNSWFKFVVNNSSDELEIAKLIDVLHLNPMRIILMPQGVDEETLNKNMQLCADIALTRGWRMTTRLQIALWGNKRGT